MPMPLSLTSAYQEPEDVEMVFRTYGKFIREGYQIPKLNCASWDQTDRCEIGANFATPQDTETQRKTATDWGFQCVAVSWMVELAGARF